jgi:hypothetical protein
MNESEPFLSKSERNGPFIARRILDGIVGCEESPLQHTAGPRVHVRSRSVQGVRRLDVGSTRRDRAEEA